MTTRLVEATNTVLVLTCFGILLVFVALSYFAHPAPVDDFCFANEFKAYGIMGGLVRQYLIWSGGYTSTFVSGVVPNLFDYLEMGHLAPPPGGIDAARPRGAR